MSGRPRLRLSIFSAVICAAALWTMAGSGPTGSDPSAPTHPILFVTQVPIPNDFATIGSTFANHLPGIAESGRGGDLYIRYPDGALRNLTKEAGFGSTAQFVPPNGWTGPAPEGFQDANAIAVRDPHVHWSGARAVFSMVVGSPVRRFGSSSGVWQLYEVTGLARGETAVITRVPGQPATYNNVEPAYLSDDRIVFVSDRPHNGKAHLYPQHDEYESTPSVTGLWALTPATGALQLLEHSPSGSFSPLVDSFGRVVFTRWDHLQRDQQADVEQFGTFDYLDESPSGAAVDRSVDVFPEPRQASARVAGHRFNHFFPWQIHQDGTGLETLNHIGRHELHAFFDRSFRDDGNLRELIDSVSGRFNPESIRHLFQIVEDPLRPGRYVGTDAPEFGTHASGRLVSLEAPPERPADRIAVTALTHPDTGGTEPSANHTGHYRDPLLLSDGGLIAVHSPEQGEAGNVGSRSNPQPEYQFRLRTLEARGAAQGGYWQAVDEVTDGIVATVSYWDPDELVQYSGPLWEMSPVEVRPRPVPPMPGSELGTPELERFTDADVSVRALQEDLRRRGLAMIVSRNVTTRDAADRQQPFNLRVQGFPAQASAQTTGAPGAVYPVAHLQLFQADLIRGIGGIDSPEPGRRVLARPLHDVPAELALDPAGPPGSVAIAPDGSIAALVPAHRAVTWQLTDAAGEPVVRERYWLSFQPGEIRVCPSCHGLNSRDQAGQTAPVNSPAALLQLLERLAPTLEEKPLVPRRLGAR